MTTKLTYDDVQKMYNYTKGFEGLRLEAYTCSAGKLTIGYGRNCIANPVKNITKVGDTITLEQANQLFENDWGKAVVDVQKKFPWVLELSPARQYVLYDMCFNMGIGNKTSGLSSFVNTLKLIEDGNYTQAASNMLDSKWAKQVGRRASILSGLMKTGVWR